MVGRPFWKSKKFWMSVAGALAVVLASTLGVPEETTMSVAGIIIAYLLGQGIADHGKEKELIRNWVEDELKKLQPPSS